MIKLIDSALDAVENVVFIALEIPHQVIDRGKLPGLGRPGNRVAGLSIGYATARALNLPAQAELCWRQD